MKKNPVKSYLEFINEDNGVAYATQGGATGMGAVISPGVHTCPGVPGSAGSGDFGAPFLPTSALKNTIYKNRKNAVDTKPQRNSKAFNKLKSIAKTKRVKQDNMSLAKSFSDFIKDYK